MKRFTQSLFVALLGLLGLPLNGMADTKIDFNAMNVKTSSSESGDGDITENLIITQDGITLTVSPAAEGVTNPNRFWGTNAGPQLRCYSGTITIEAENTIKSVVFDAPSKFDVAADNGTLEGKTWNGEAQKIVFTVNKNTQINSITVSAEAAEVPTMPEAANIAAFKALDKGTEAKLTLKDAYVTAISGSNAYVQDATGAIYFYNTGLTLEAGKVLNGTVTGKLDIYNNLPEFAKTAGTNADGITATDGTTSAKKVTVAEALTAENISMFVNISSAAIEADNGKYYAVDGDSKIQIYDQFKVLAANFQYPAKADITGIIGMYKGTPQVYPYDANSITEAVQGDVRIWDFTKWSDATVANLKADAAASKTTGWSVVEKAADAQNDAEPTDISKDNCFWYQADANADGTLSANGVVIEELKGLVFDTEYANKRSLAIAVNYPSTSLGDYAGGAYLWLGGGGSKQTCPCFTIPNVAAGSTITIEAESDKPSDARGIGLYAGSFAEENLIGEQFKPTTKVSYTWTIENATNVVVWNTSGCHLYTIKVESDATGVQAVKKAVVSDNAIYNLRGQKMNGALPKGIYIQNGKKFIVK